MFSVVVPVWNKAHTLERTLASAFAQTWREFELIVVDDGSTDASLDVVRRFGDPRLRVIEQSNAGQGLARNTGIAAARHDWIAFLDGDDLWLPEHLAELDRIRTRHPEAGLIGTSFIASDRTGRFQLPPDGPGVIETVSYFDRIARGERVLWSSSAAIARNVWESLGGFRDFPSGEDSEYWVRIALQWPVARSTRTNAVYLRGTGGIKETEGTRWLGRELRGLSDLSPSVATVMQHYGEHAGRKKELDPYIAFYVDICVRESIGAGDVQTLRALRRAARGHLRPEHRAALLLARLPSPVARALFRLAHSIRRRTRRFTAKWACGAPAPR